MLTILAALAGCVEPGPAPPEFAQIDSAGVILAVTPGPDARAPIGWEIDSIPDLVIGGADYPSEDLFRVQGVRETVDDGVVIVDGGSRELRFFDSNGRLLDRVGGRGDGPGEFRNPVLVPALGTDSLLIWDTGLRRFQMFSGDGQAHRTIPVRGWPAGGRPPVGAVGMAMLVETREAMGPEDFQVEGPMERTREYVWFDTSDGAEVALASFAVARSYTQISRNGRSGTSLIPFSSAPAGAVTRDGALITDGRIPEIREYDLEGRLRRIFRVDEPAHPVTAEMIQDHLEVEASGFSADVRDRMERRYAEMPIPDVLPVFQSLLVDEVGWIWAELYEWDTTRAPVWMVFDPSGRARGTIQTPAGLVIHRIGADFLLGVATDDLGIEYVRRHELRRGGSFKNIPQPPEPL